MSSSGQHHGPYVGPRAYQQGETLYGRDRETRDLTNLLIAERIVLLYSPSGAGKSSLIHASVVPAMRRESFYVWPTVILKRAAGDDPEISPETNPYVMSTLLSLEESLPKQEQRPLDYLSRLSLQEYLDARDERQGGKARFEVLIFDQFEEILTLDSLDIEHKVEFFRQLGRALESPNRWALFGMREEYLAGLDPYLKYIPTRLANHFRLDLLDETDASEAIRRPAQQENVTFSDDAVKLLVRNLQGATDTDSGNRYIEPVQLQVVCLKLWDKLHPASGDEIDADRLGTLSDVDSALSDYYARGVASAAAISGVPEGALRDWFEKNLLTRDGIRRQTRTSPAGAAHAGPDPVRELEDYHLVRTEERRGARWTELSHDRLVDAVIRDNSSWRNRNLSEFQIRARLWDQLGRPTEQLIFGGDLQNAENWTEAHDEDITDLDHQYLAESRKLQKSKEELAEAEGRLSKARKFATLKNVVLTLLAALILIIYSLYRQNQELAAANALWAQTQARLSEYITSFESAPELYMLLTLETLSANRAEYTNPQQQLSFFRRGLNVIPKTRVLRGHDFGLLDVEFMSDSRVVTSDSDATIRIWDSATGLEEQTLYFHNSAVNALAINEDGSLLASAADDGTVAIWTIEPGTGKCALRYAIAAHADSAEDVNFSPDGKRFATAGKDGFIRVWEAESGRQLSVTPRQARGVNSVDFGPDGLLMVSGDDGGNVVVWNTSRGHQRWRYAKTTGPINKVAFGPRGDTIAAAVRDDDAIVWKVGSGRVLSQVNHGHFGSVTTLVFSPDGKRLVTGGFDHTTRVWDIDTGRALRTFSGHDGFVNAVSFSPDGRYMVTASSDRTARILDLKSSDATRYTIDSNLDIESEVRFSRDGKYILVTESSSGATLWDRQTHEPAARFDENEYLLDVALSADGKLLATAHRNGVRIWQTNASEGEPVELKQHSAGVLHIDFSPDGKFLATASRDRFVRLYDSGNGELIEELAENPAKIGDIRFSPDGRLLAFVDWEGWISVWQMDNMTRIREKRISKEALLSVEFSPDGATLLAGGKDRLVWLWDSKSLLWDSETEPGLVLKGHQGNINVVAIDSAGKILATSSYDGAVRIWDAESGILMENLAFDNAGISSIDLSPDGNYLAVSRIGGDLQIYALGIDEVIGQMKSRMDRYLTDEECRRHLEGACSESALMYFDRGRRLVTENAGAEMPAQASEYFHRSFELDPNLIIDLESQQDRWRMSGLYNHIRDEIYNIDLPFTADDRKRLEKLKAEVESWSHRFADPAIDAEGFIDYQLVGRTLDEGYRQARAGKLAHAAKYFALAEKIASRPGDENPAEDADPVQLADPEANARALQTASRIRAYELVGKADGAGTTEAIELLREALEIDPLGGLVHHRLGLMLFESGIYDEARDMLATAIELDAEHPAYLSDLANLLLVEGNNRQQNYAPLRNPYYRDAMRYAQRAIDINPYLSEPRIIAAEILLAQGRPDLSISHLSNINLNDQNYITGLKYSGPIYFDAVEPKQFEAAYQHVRQIVEIEPYNDSYLASYAEAALVTYRLRESLDVAQKLIDMEYAATENRNIARYIKTASLLLQDETGAATEALADFVDSFNSRDADMKNTWSFDGEKYYICSGEIAANKQALLLKLITAIEQDRAELDAAALADMIDSGDDPAYRSEVTQMCAGG